MIFIYRCASGRVRRAAIVCIAAAACVSARGADTAPGAVERLYETAAELMGAGDLEGAQARFDSAFATAGVERTEVYPLLLNEQATLRTWRGERREAIAGKRAVIPMLARFGDTELDVSVYSDLGLLYSNLNDPDSAMYFYQKADSAARVLGDDGWQALVTQNIGVMYYNMRRYADAERYLRRAVGYGDRTDDVYSMVTSRQLLAAARQELGDGAEAGGYILSAWRLARGSGNRRLMLRCIPTLYRHFDAAGRRDSADYYMALGEEMLREEPEHSVLWRGYVMARARMHMERGEYGEALRWYHRQAASPMQTERGALMQSMARCYAGMGRMDMAYQYMDSSRMWGDTLARRDVASRLEEFNHRYRALEKEIENAGLRQNVLRRDRALLGTVAIALLLGIGVVLLWMRLRVRRQRQLSLMKQKELEVSQNYIQGLEDERKYVAKELHDGVANDLLGLRMSIEAGVSDAARVAAAVDHARDTVRRISHNLMPPEFDHMTLEEVIGAYVEGVGAHDGDVELTYDGSLTHQPEKQVSRDIYRVAQEYLSNLIRHGSPRRVEVRLCETPDGGVELSIADDSRREAAATAPAAHGIGLRTMADRAKALGATIEIDTEGDGSTRMVLRVPR